MLPGQISGPPDNCRTVLDFEKRKARFLHEDVLITPKILSLNRFVMLEIPRCTYRAVGCTPREW